MRSIHCICIFIPFLVGHAFQWPKPPLSFGERSFPAVTPPSTFTPTSVFVPNTMPLSVKNLLKGIEKHQFERIAFDENTVYTKDKDNHYTYITRVNTYTSTKLVDASLSNGMDPIFVTNQNNLIADAGTFFFNSIVLFIAFRTLQNIVGLFLNPTNAMNRNGRFKNMVGNNSNSNNRGFGFDLGGGGNYDSPFLRDRKEKPMVNINVTLADWAGSPEVREECTEIITYLNNDTNYMNAGAVIPKGILMEGPPGTGKTLLAKAIACEAKAEFIEISGSEFIEVYVGVGAMRVRKLFEDARERKPCVVFIDEIDAIGKQRSNSAMGMGGNEEKDQTLNQLLSEMDGFNNNDGIIVLAATNRRDILDKALLRPGRFDRIINIPLPDTRSRAQILDVYLKTKKVAPDVRSGELATLTAGFSGAALKNLVNEAAIVAARKNETVLSTAYLLEAFEKSIIGIKKTVDDRSDEVKRRVAIHEVGHAFLASLYTEYFDLQKVSIQATYGGAGGFTIFTEKETYSTGGLYTKDMLIKRLVVALGGKAAEAVFFGEEKVSVGATMDLNQANSVAADMIEKYGMGTELVAFYKNQPSEPYSKYSETTKTLIDQEANRLVKDAYLVAIKLIQSNLVKVNALVDELLEKTTVDASSYYKQRPTNDRS